MNNDIFQINSISRYLKWGNSKNIPNISFKRFSTDLILNNIEIGYKHQFQLLYQNNRTQNPKNVKLRKIHLGMLKSM